MPQEVSIDLEMDWDISAAAASDELQDALNYKEVSHRVIAFVQDGAFELVETAADRTAAMIVEEFSVPRVKLTFSKPRAVTGSAAVGICVEKTAGE